VALPYCYPLQLMGRLHKAEKADVAETLKPDGCWLGVRNDSTYHNDTLTDRIAP
jgi:hypothetical protein